MEDYYCFVMTDCCGFHWNLVSCTPSYPKCLLCYLLFVVSAWCIWSWTLTNDWFSATVIQAFLRISFFCKWVCKTVHFFVMTNCHGCQWNLVRSMISFLGCLILNMLFIFFLFYVFGFELRAMTGLALSWWKSFKRVSWFLCKWVWKTILVLSWLIVAVSSEIW